MAESISMRKGFSQVDGQADPGILIAGMEATARWPAVQRLRRWERERLQVTAGDHVLDVGCGAGDVLVELAGVVGPAGSATGIDASEQMLAATRDRAEREGVSVELAVGDATDLQLDAATFNAVRCERTLQWVHDPGAAVRELVRVTAPGGRVCVMDTDWRTLLIDHPDPALLQRFLETMAAVRGEQVTVGARLVNLLRNAGLSDVGAAAETHMWLEWNPDESLSPPGMVPLRFVAADLVEQGLLEATEAEAMIGQFEQSARDGRFFVALTMFAACGMKPS